MSQKEEITLDVRQMTCSSCVRHVEHALREVPGVANVAVALREGKARIERDPSKATVDALIRAVEDAGYDAAVTS